MRNPSSCSPNHEYHVAHDGSDAGPGTQEVPFRTIQRAAQAARAGDMITVHEGVYRERVDPPRGGTSDEARIVYRAAPGERVVIKGSEILKGWNKFEGGSWEVTVPNSFFGEFNPFNDLIWGDWFYDLGRKHHTGAVYLNEHWLVEAATREEVLAADSERQDGLWFAEVSDENTRIFARFSDADPNEQTVEINVRQTVFYPQRPGINFITVQGFVMMHAATPWAPPTAEQIGLLGTHWSKGWVIQANEVRYSTCAGITLGKHGDEFDNTSADSAEGYVETIRRAARHGWTKENIGHHVVCDNRISHCEQAGLVGSLGAAFSTITGNHIHDIHVRRLFSGAEMAGIKFHAALDTYIGNNHVHDCHMGLWLDWMTEGTRVTRNLFYDNIDRDIFFEVNHGPFLVDNNLFFSDVAIQSWSAGGAYVHNLFAGCVAPFQGDGRITPFMVAHSTEVAGLSAHTFGDDRFINNIFVGHGIEQYDEAKLPVIMEGNLFLNGAKPSKHEADPEVLTEKSSPLGLLTEAEGIVLHMNLDDGAIKQPRRLVTSEGLGNTHASGLPFVQPDGSPYRIDTDYFLRNRNVNDPAPGPFEDYSEAQVVLWHGASVSIKKY